MELALSWAAVIAIFLATEYAMFSANIFWLGMGFWALCIAVLPAVVNRNLTKILPFELLFLISIPFYLYLIPHALEWHDRFYYDNLLRASQVVATFFIGFVTVMDLHVYTRLRMNRTFAVSFTVMLSMSFSSYFAIAQFISDHIFGTAVVASNRELMMDLAYGCFGGIAMGLILVFYLRQMPPERLGRYNMARIGGGK